MVSGAESVIVPAVPPKNAVSALVKLATTDASVPADEEDQYALVVSQAPDPPMPAVAPLAASQYRFAAFAFGATVSLTAHVSASDRPADLVVALFGAFLQCDGVSASSVEALPLRIAELDLPPEALLRRACAESSSHMASRSYIGTMTPPAAATGAHAAAVTASRPGSGAMGSDMSSPRTIGCDELACAPMRSTR